MTANIDDDKKNGKPHKYPRLWRVLVGALWLLGIVAIVGTAAFILWRISFCLDKTVSDPAQFITGNLLNVLILLAIVGQIAVYVKQRDIMQGQWDVMQNQIRMQAAVNDPRLRIAVSARNFEPGKAPIFLVTITNDGLIPAANVTFQLVVKLPEREISIQDTFDVPAKESEIQFLRSPSIFDKEQIEKLNTKKSPPLIVSGTLSYFPFQREGGDPPQEFCFKYNPWSIGNRPKEIPQFVRCTRTGTVLIGGLAPTLKTGITPSTAELEPIGHAPTVAIGHKGEIAPTGDLSLNITRGTPEEDKSQNDKKEERNP